MQLDLAGAVRDAGPVAQENDDRVLGETFPDLGCELIAGMAHDGAMKLHVDRTERQRVSRSDQTAHTRDDLFQFLEKRAAVEPLAHDPAQDDALDRMSKLEQFRDTLRAVIGDPHPALIAFDENAAQVQFLDRLAGRHSADIQHGGQFGLGDALSRALLTHRDGENDAFLDFIGGGLRARDRRKCGSPRPGRGQAVILLFLRRQSIILYVRSLAGPNRRSE